MTSMWFVNLLNTSLWRKLSTVLRIIVMYIHTGWIGSVITKSMEIKMMCINIHPHELPPHFVVFGSFRIPFGLLVDSLTNPIFTRSLPFGSRWPTLGNAIFFPFLYIGFKCWYVGCSTWNIRQYLCRFMTYNPNKINFNSRLYHYILWEKFMGVNNNAIFFEPFVFAGALLILCVCLCVCSMQVRPGKRLVATGGPHADPENRGGRGCH